MDDMTERGAETGRARRRRAPAMSLQDRRAAIIEATVPLLLAGDTDDISTTRIAAAAGIAEGTVFRAFQDKKELLLACAHQALVADAEVRRIQEIDRREPLAARLTAAIDVVGDYLDRIWSVMQTMQAAGVRWEHGPGAHKHGGHDEQAGDERAGDKRAGGQGREGPMQMGRLSSALAELFAPESEGLRASPELAAQLLLGSVFASRRNNLRFGGAVDNSKIVDLFLHGALITQTDERPESRGGTP